VQGAEKKDYTFKWPLIVEQSEFLTEEFQKFFLTFNFF